MAKCSRRQFSVYAASGTLTAMVLRGRLALAQDLDFKLLQVVVQEDRAISEKESGRVRQFTPLGQKEAEQISNYSYERRLGLAQELTKLNQSGASQFAALRSNAQLLDARTGYLINDFEQAAVSPVPEPLEITRDPYEVLVSPQPLSHEEKWKVILDILLETLGLAPIRELTLEILVQLDGYAKQETLVRDAIQKSDADKMRDAIFGLIDWFLEKTVLQSFIRELILKRVAGVLLSSLALKCVPFVGWGWMLVAFGLAVNRNWNRLTS